jgi:tRNA-specific 2-thiouridylase
MSRIVLAMSGGVDSSVAAHLLTEAGHDVIGVFMRHGEQSPVACATEGARRRGQEAGNSIALPILSRLDHKQGCCTAADAEDARRVADKLGIPFYALNLNEEFGEIIDYFVAEYTAGRTPNPCVQCNNWIKFGKLFDYADSVGAEFVATGHYAQLETRADGDVALVRGVDAAKDQSYVLFGIRRELLARMMLPVGGYEKPAIRRIAASLGLRVAEKKDSQEICFVTQDRYDEFVRRHADEDRGGEMVTTDGRVVGRHRGIESFTVGQRKGLGVALGDRMFVVRIDPESRRVVIGDREALYECELTARDVNWLDAGDKKGDILLFSDDDEAGNRTTKKVECPLFLPCHAQIRYNAEARPATLTLLPDRRLRLRFDEPQFAITPGQAVVVYDASTNSRVLGGGWIE